MGDHQNKNPGEVNTVTRTEKVTIVLACTWVNILCVGYAVGLGVIFVPILDVFQTSRAQTSLMLSLCMGVIFGGAIFCGPIVKKLQPGNAVILGGLIASVGNVGASFAPDANTLIVTVGVINGAGLCLSHLSSYVTLTAVFGRRQGMAVAALKVGSGVGGLLFPQLNVFLLDFYGWRGTFLLKSALLLNLFISGFVFRIITKKRGLDKQKKPSEESLDKSHYLNLFKRPSFLVFTLWQTPFYVFVMSQIFFLVDMATGRGFSLETSSLFLSGCTFGNVFGSSLSGLLMSLCNMTGQLVCLLSCLLLAMSSVGFIYSHTFVTLMVSSIICGVGFGLNLPSTPVCLLQIVDIREYPFGLSFMYSLSGLGDLTSGPVGGAIYDLTGSYYFVFYLTIVVCCIMAVINLAIEMMLRWRPKHSEKEPSPNEACVSTETVVTTL